ncbi:MAG: dihydropteroate synthase [Bacteroidota bacterium]|nr:dihydropteroate synthase [Bacteroidota bacterium]
MFTLNCNGRLLKIDKPVVMGIINATPDSFYKGSRAQVVDAALQQAETMLTEGATFLDIGGQSTAPGSVRMSSEEEAGRVLPIIEAIHKQFPEAYISIDTFYADVAKQSVAVGARLINDISGGTMDEAMFSTVAHLGVPYVLMHIKGTPQTMQQHAVYQNITKEVLDYFIQKTEVCKRSGIHDIIIDPGFGFAKTIAHNFELLNHLELLQMLQKPLLAGVSRKATIYKTVGTTPDKALNGTTVLNTVALLKGANILRVHDVKEAVEAIELIEHMKKK